MPPGETGTPVRKFVHTAVYKQKLHQYNNTLKLYENCINELSKQKTVELDKTITNVDSVVNNFKSPPVSKLRRFKSQVYNITPLPPYLFKFPHIIALIAPIISCVIPTNAPT